MKYPYIPAAFINAIHEEGTKEEAIKYLQETWNEMIYWKKAYQFLAQNWEKEPIDGPHVAIA